MVSHGTYMGALLDIAPILQLIAGPAEFGNIYILHERPLPAPEGPSVGWTVVFPRRQGRRYRGDGGCIATLYNPYRGGHLVHISALRPHRSYARCAALDRLGPLYRLLSRLEVLRGLRTRDLRIRIHQHDVDARLADVAAARGAVRSHERRSRGDAVVGADDQRLNASILRLARRRIRGYSAQTGNE